MTAVQLMELMLEAGANEEYGHDVPRIENAADQGWLVEDGAAVVELANGRKYIVRISEV